MCHFGFAIELGDIYSSSQYIASTSLLIILVRLIVDNVEEPKLIYTLGCRYNAQPVTELLLLEELLRPAGHRCISTQPCSTYGHPILAVVDRRLHTYKYLR